MNTNDTELEQGLLSGTRSQKTVRRHAICSRGRLLMTLILLTTLTAFVYLTYGSPVTTLKPITPSLNIPQDIQLNWAQYSPYIPLDSYRNVPKGCEIDQVNILQRHGARFPTSGAGARIEAALAKLMAVKHYTDPDLDFLHTFKYDLGHNDLVPFGAAQSFDAGVEVFQRYSHLINSYNLPFVRASGSERVIASAINWTQGIATASYHKYNPKLSVILDETLNDTLDDKMCPSAGSSDPQTNAWLATYAPPITQRLNKGAPQANLTDVDVYSLISLCPFESVSKERMSQFCDLFAGEKGAFSGFAYNGDLDKFYGTGYGQELGPVQGVGYVNELLARLTQTPVKDNTQTNHTLDSDPETFPLDRSVYADFSHDNQMIAIYAAIGLFHQAKALDPTKPSHKRTWRVSSMVPFSSRMVVERLNCGQKRSVRILVNQEVQPLEFCGGDKHGVCSLDAFVESQGFARNNGNGDFEKCFA